MATKKSVSVKTNVGANPHARTPYTLEQRLNALALLREENYDYNKVATITGVNKCTLRSWLNRHGDAKPDDAANILIARAEMNLQKIKRNFITDHLKDIDELCTKAIIKARELLEVEEDLNKVNNTIKILTDFFSKLEGTEEENKKDSSVTVNLIQDSIRRLNEAR